MNIEHSSVSLQRRDNGSYACSRCTSRFTNERTSMKVKWSGKPSMIVPSGCGENSSACLWEISGDNQLHYWFCSSVVWVCAGNPNGWIECATCFYHACRMSDDNLADRTLGRGLPYCVSLSFSCPWAIAGILFHLFPKCSALSGTYM